VEIVFTLFTDFGSRLFSVIHSEGDFNLIKKTGVHGEEFYHDDAGENVVRFCYAEDDTVLDEACRRIERLSQEERRQRIFSTVASASRRARQCLTLISIASSPSSVVATNNPVTDFGLEPKSVNCREQIFSVNQSTEKVGEEAGLDVKINNIENPRIEAEEHYYKPLHTGLLELGLKPHPLTDEVLARMIEIVLRYKANIKKHAIFRGIKWK